MGIIEAGYLLIVEDDTDILALLKMALSMKGYRVVTATNGLEALHLIQNEHPILVIADIMMPHLDGYGLIHRLRVEPSTRRIPVVFITATYVTPEDKDFALSIGAARFIQKPVEVKTFLSIIAQLLEEQAAVSKQPQDDLAFYESYRKRLAAKLEQKNKQVVREDLSHIHHQRRDHHNPQSNDPNHPHTQSRSSREVDELRSLIEQVEERIAALQESNSDQ